MADDKIRISWEEVQSTQVDARLAHQAALNRTQQHVHAQTSPAAPTAFPHAAPTLGPLPGVATDRNGLWYNTVFYMAVFGLTGGLLAWLSGEFVWAALGNAYRDDQPVLVLVLIYYMAISVILATTLAIGEPMTCRNWRGAIVNGSVGASLGLIGGLLAVFVVGLLYSGLGGGQSGFTVGQVLVRSVAWAVLGLFLSLAPGLVLKSWKRLAIGIVAGFVGGFVGGMMFDPVFAITGNDSLSRFVGLVVIGTAIGAGTGVIENVAKTGWLRVTGGPIVGKQFVLYKNPTYIGSSPQCEIYLFKDPRIAPRHAAIHTVPGGFDLEDLRSAAGSLVNGRSISRVRLRGNDVVQISGTWFSFQEKARTSP